MRKKISKEEKKVSFGITIDPEIEKLLTELSKKEDVSRSSIVEKALKEFMNK